jgi:hypothetical protein
MSPVVNIGLQRLRDRIYASTAAVIDSIGFGTSNAAEDATDTVLGTGAADSYWKTTSSAGWVAPTVGGDGTVDPWVQFESSWSTAEANGATIFEVGLASGTLNGQNPAGEDGTKLFSRKRVGGASGIGKTADIDLVVRIRVTF